MASSLFNRCALQSFSTISLQVFFGLPLGLAPSTSYSCGSCLLSDCTCFNGRCAGLLVQQCPHTRIQLFYASIDFVRDNLGKPVPEKTFTHSHLSWSSIVPYLLHPSTTIHGIPLVQSTLTTVFFHNLSPSFLWSTSWPLSQATMPSLAHIHIAPVDLCCTSTHRMSLLKHGTHC